MFVRSATIAAVIAASASVDARTSQFKGLLRSDDDAARRELKASKRSKGSKSSKSSKGTMPVCLSFGEVDKIKGTDMEQTGPGLDEANPECNALDPSEWDSDDCAYYEEPFTINFSVGATTTFVFDDGTKYGFGLTPDTKAPLGDGALCGSVGSNTADKVQVTYVGDITDLAAPDQDLQDKPAKHLQNMKYSFWVESCPTAGSSPCPNEFYLNIYTRQNKDSTNYYDCRFDYVPSQGGDVNTWTTFDLYDILNVPVRANPLTFSGTPIFVSDDCDGSVTTLQEYIGAEKSDGNDVVLGTTFGEAFKLNIGDTNPKDGISGCFDDLQLKLTDETATRVYDFEN